MDQSTSIVDPYRIMTLLIRGFGDAIVGGDLSLILVS